MANSIEQEIGRRRTFAIISHPDAGKTTLTEKLYYSLNMKENVLIFLIHQDMRTSQKILTVH